MKRPNRLQFLFAAGATLSGLVAAAQPAAQPARPAHPPTTVERRADGSIELIRYERATAPRESEAPATLRAALGLSAQNELRPLRAAETDALGFTRQRYQQVYQGVPVEFSAYTTVARSGVVELMTGEIHPLADGALAVRPTLSADQALPAALAFVGARQYMWQVAGEAALARQTEQKASFRPTGELVIVDDILTGAAPRPVLAWKFNIYAARPLSRAWVYVDAQTGRVVNQDAIIKHTNATGTFATRYSGARTIITDKYQLAPLRYRLRETGRGQGLETYRWRRNTQDAVDLTDADNNWTAAEYDNAAADNIAGDAHFGAEAVYDYWKTEHGRNSFDNAGARMYSFVHYDTLGGSGYDNAFWNGSAMYYGDGRTTFRPLAAIDVCAHELGHAICQYTANLKYQNESGALNEGFSDIWGACVEVNASLINGLAGNNMWLIGERVMQAGQGAALRSMSNPKQFGQPDTYKGTNWYAGGNWDNGGVHRNSGVLNRWFYLLSVGGSGTNDKGNAYSVTSIGVAKAAKIAYATEQLLAPTSNFFSARNVAIQAATSLYGANSSEVRAVTNAWYAVGVGNSIAYGTATTGYVDVIGFGSLFRSSGNDGGYYDGTGLLAPVVTRCAQYSLLYSAGGVSAATVTYWNAWADFNQDGDFNDAGERIVTNVTATGGGAQSANIVLPSAAALGYTRLRVAMSAGTLSSPNWSVGTGEVEEYYILVGAAVTVATPSGLTATNITAHGATVNWTSVAGASSYTVRYRMVGNATWTIATAVAPYTGKILLNLVGGKQYQYTVQAVNGCGTTGIASQSAFFSTPAGRPGADQSPPDSLTAATAATAARTLGVAAPAATLTASAYPNPAHNVLRLTLTDAQQTAQAVTSVAVFDQRGARVLTVPFDGATGTLRLESLKPGLYTATVRSAAASAKPVRFVKE